MNKEWHKLKHSHYMHTKKSIFKIKEPHSNSKIPCLLLARHASEAVALYHQKQCLRQEQGLEVLIAQSHSCPEK